jgi:hypothetical protein
MQTNPLKADSTTLRWNRSSYFLMSVFVATLLLVVVVWWPLARKMGNDARVLDVLHPTDSAAVRSAGARNGVSRFLAGGVARQAIEVRLGSEFRHSERSEESLSCKAETPRFARVTNEG